VQDTYLSDRGVRHVLLGILQLISLDYIAGDGKELEGVLGHEPPVAVLVRERSSHKRRQTALGELAVNRQDGM